jgi:hypothetical protein
MASMANDGPSRRLSPKEEMFCLAIVEGLSKSDAYRKAYNPQRAKAKTIHEKASRIMARGKVRARIAERGICRIARRLPRFNLSRRPCASPIS